jgi:hypothetical protein
VGAKNSAAWRSAVCACTRYTTSVLYIVQRLRDGIEPQSLATFRNLQTLSRRRLDQVLRRYPENVQDSACRIMRAGHRRRADRR